MSTPAADRGARRPWALGLAASNGPDYAGSDKRGSNLRPVIGLDIGRYTISSGGGGSLLDFDLEPRCTGVGARVLDADRLKLSAGLRIGGARTSDADSPLYGLPDVRKTLRARLSASWLFSPELSLRSSLNQDLLGRKGGTTLQTTLQYEWQITPSTEIGLAAGFTLADSTHLRSFFGVPADVALVRTPYAAYAPGGGVKSTDLGIEIKSAITDRWVLFGGVRFSQLRGDAHRGSLVGAGSRLGHEDHVHVAHVVQLARPGLAHPDDGQPAVLVTGPELLAGDVEGGLQRGLGQLGERLGGRWQVRNRVGIGQIQGRDPHEFTAIGHPQRVVCRCGTSRLRSHGRRQRSPQARPGRGGRVGRSDPMLRVGGEVIHQCS